jgi:hypothetical protein
VLPLEAHVNVYQPTVRVGALLNPPVSLCGAACKPANESFTVAPHPTWGREQSPLAGNCQRAFYCATSLLAFFQRMLESI